MTHDTALTVAAGHPAATLETLRVPAELEFSDNEAGFLPAFGCDERVDELRGRYEELADLADVAIKVLWAKQGGTANGKARLGKCVKTSGPVRHFARCDYLIILSADHCRAFALADRQLEALLYHELKHIAVEYDDEDNAVLKTRPHDVEAFYDEVRRYGLWTAELKEMREVAAQAPLPGIDVVSFGGSV